jgi:EmrB/QacA subfamily drug resistance transporter
VTPDLGQRDPRRWQFLGVLLAGCFMAILDVFIVNVAAPNIQDRLGTDAGTLELIVAGYTLAYAMVLITGARLGDDHGHRRYFLFGVALFTVASAICGAAPTSTVLIVARVMQGIAAGLLVPQVLSIIQVRFAGNERTRAFGIYGLVLGLASVAGQIIGGVLLVWNPFDLGWRVVFLVNVPIGLATLVLGARLIPESRADEPRAVDPVGIALLSAGVLALVYPLIRGREAGWAPWVWAMLGAGVVLLAVFVAVERSRTRAARSTLLDLEVFESHDFGWGLASIFFLQCCAASMFLVLTVYLQDGRGFTPIESGLTYLPLGMAFALASLFVRRLGPRVQAIATPLGILGLAVADALLALAVHRTGEWSVIWAVPLLIVLGGGQGAAYTSIVTVVLSRVRHRHVASASGLLVTTVQLGNLLGVATLGSLFFALRDGSTKPIESASNTALSVTLAVTAVVALVAAVCFTRLDEPTISDLGNAEELVVLAE